MTFVLVVLIALFGAFIRTVFGFGEALVTMPLLALISFDLKTSTALIGILGLLVAIPATIKFHEYIDFSVVKRLVLGSLLGVPVGLALVVFVKTAIIIHLLGVVLISYGGYNLWRNLTKQKGTTPSKLHSNYWDYLAGALSGVLGSAYNSHGVVVVIYGTLKRWSVDKLKGILQAHFVCVGLIIVISQMASGLWNMEVVKLLLYIVPLLFIVIPFGNWVNRKIDSALLIKYIYMLLVIFGVILLFKTN